MAHLNYGAFKVPKHNIVFFLHNNDLYTQVAVNLCCKMKSFSGQKMFNFIVLPFYFYFSVLMFYLVVLRFYVVVNVLFLCVNVLFCRVNIL